MCDVTFQNRTGRRIRISLGTLSPIDLNPGQNRRIFLNNAVNASVVDLSNCTFISCPPLAVNVSFNGFNYVNNRVVFPVNRCGTYTLRASGILPPVPPIPPTPDPCFSSLTNRTGVILILRLSNGTQRTLYQGQTANVQVPMGVRVFDQFGNSYPVTITRSDGSTVTSASFTVYNCRNFQMFSSFNPDPPVYIYNQPTTPVFQSDPSGPILYSTFGSKASNKVGNENYKNDKNGVF